MIAAGGTAGLKCMIAAEGTAGLKCMITAERSAGGQGRWVFASAAWTPASS